MEERENNFFCTIVGKAYLIKGLTLYYSILKNMKNFHLWICCVDEDVYNVLSKLHLVNVTLYRTNDIEDKELLIAKGNRSIREYCWTLKAPLILHIFESCSEVNTILYLDADLYFFDNAKQIYNEWGNGSILLCEQRDGWNDNIFGKYQAGLLGFRKDKSGLECLRWWRKRCIEWCYDTYDDRGRWGDQRYMNNWNELFEGVVVVKSLGIDAAAWYQKYYDINIKRKKVYINNDKLVLYHFTSFYIINKNEFALWKWHNLSLDVKVVKMIYKPYIKDMKYAIDKIDTVVHKIEDFYSSELHRGNVANYFKYAGNNAKVKNH
jgi:hypothetical protein